MSYSQNLNQIRAKLQLLFQGDFFKHLSFEFLQWYEGLWKLLVKKAVLDLKKLGSTFFRLAFVLYIVTFPEV